MPTFLREVPPLVKDWAASRRQLLGQLWGEEKCSPRSAQSPSVVGSLRQRQGLFFGGETALVYSFNLGKWERKVRTFGLAGRDF